MKRLLFICTTKDAAGRSQDECLDAALTCAAMGFDTEVIFTKEALESSTQPVRQKMETADQFGITICINSEGEHEPSNDDISPKELHNRIQHFDHAIHF